MSQDSTGGLRGFRDTAQVDMPMAPPRPTGPLAGGSALATESRPVPVPEQRMTGEQPMPLLQLSEGLATVRTVERHLDEILAAVPQPHPIELAVLDAQGLLCAEEVISQRA